MWDVLSGDFDESLNKEKCLDNVLKKTKPGSIIVFHDSSPLRLLIIFHQFCRDLNNPSGEDNSKNCKRIDLFFYITFALYFLCDDID